MADDGMVEGWELLKEVYDEGGELFFDTISDFTFGCSTMDMWQLGCAKSSPQVKGLRFLLTGSKKEGGSKSRLFSPRVPPVFETDAMVTLEGQTLETHQEELLIRDTEHPGFVRLKYPGKVWVDAFGGHGGEPSSEGFISAQFCRGWLNRIVNVCMSKKDMHKTVGQFNDFDITETPELQGPAYTRKMDILGGSLYLFHRLSNESDIIQPESLELLIQITDELDQCSVDIAGKQTMAQSCMDISLDRNTGYMSTGEKKLNDPRNETRPDIISPLKKMLNILNSVKRLDHADTLNLKAGFEWMDCNLLEDVLAISELFSSLKASVEDFIFWKMWKSLKLCDMIEATKNLHRGECLPKGEIDFVYSVKCHFWPLESKAWTTRIRPFDFPSLKQCDEITSSGIHLVCKTYPGGDETLDWRLSFSAAEIMLASYRSAKQNLVYFIFKSIFYEQLRGIEDEKTGTSLTSYCVKTIMMWACEQYPQEFWKNSSYQTCVEVLFANLEVAFRTRTLPNYFIPEVNLFQGHVQVLDQALKVVTEIQKNVTNYPDINRTMGLVQIKNNLKKLLTWVFDCKHMLPHLHQRGDIAFAQSFENLFDNLMGHIFPIGVSTMYLEGFTNITMPLSANIVPETVFGMDVGSLRSLSRLTTGCSLKNLCFDEIIFELKELHANDFLKSIVYKVLFLDMELQNTVCKELLKKLNISKKLSLELQKWYLYRLFRCFLWGEPSHELLAIGNFVQGHPFFGIHLTTGEETKTPCQMIEKCRSVVHQWNSYDYSDEEYLLEKVPAAGDLVASQWGSIHFLATVTILCHFERQVALGTISPSSLAFVAVVKHMQTRTSDKMRRSLHQLKGELTRGS